MTSLWGSAANVATVSVALVGGTLAYAQFNSKIEDLERSNAQLTLAIEELKSGKLEAVRGPMGPAGPKGEPGPKGDPGPPGLASNVRDLEQLVAQLSARVKALEGALRARQGNAGVDNSQAQGSAPETSGGLIRLSNGCLAIPTGTEPFVDRVKPGDSFCTIDGQQKVRVSAITDSEIAYGDREHSCSTSEKVCRFRWNQRYTYFVKDIKLVKEGEVWATLEFVPAE